jgi:hypothetical protein
VHFGSRFATLGFGLAITATSLAQAPATDAVKVDKPPTIDGVIDEAAEWTNVPSVSGLFDVDDGQSSPEGAQFWLAYDDEFIYIAARVADSDPKQIRATEYRTNVGLFGNDTIEFSLDPTGSLSDFNRFQINPRGATSINLAGGRAAKREWTGEILAKGRITDKGWEAEARIPWQLMKLPSAGKRDLRFNFGRRIARMSRFFNYTYTGSGNQGNTPIWRGVLVPKAYVDRSVKLLPYTYLGYDQEDKGLFNAGLDLKTSLTDQLQLVGSINPDFRNIENQILSLDASRFERLARETRPFFLEGQEYLGSALLATQRIPSFDVGVNTYGRITDKTNFGLLNALDLDTFHQRRVNGNVVASERGTRNNFAGTVSHQIDVNSGVRAAVTSLNTPYRKNDAYLVRYYRDIGPWNVFYRDMGTKDTDRGYGRNSRSEVNYYNRGLGFSADYTYVAPEFNPALGFFPEVNYKGWRAENYYNRTYNKGPWNDWGYNLGYNMYDRANGGFYRRGANGAVFFTLRGGLAAINGFDVQQFLQDKDYLYFHNVVFPRGNPYRNVSLNYSWGRQQSESYRSLSLNGAYRLWNRLQLSANYQVQQFRGYDDLAIIGGSYDLDADRAISGRLVKQGSDLNAYVSLRKSGNRGAEYFLILGDPNARTFRSSLVLKAVFPLELGGRRKGK